jgi:hypothetical protein
LELDEDDVSDYTDDFDDGRGTNSSIILTYNRFGQTYRGESIRNFVVMSFSRYIERCGHRSRAPTLVVAPKSASKMQMER